MWMREFYANLSVVYFENPVVKIWGRNAQFRAKQIHDLYGLPNVDMVDFEAKRCELSSWMKQRLYLGKEVT